MAAVMEGRRYIGIEKERKWFEEAEKRIREAGRQLDLFVPAGETSGNTTER